MSCARWLALFWVVGFGFVASAAMAQSEFLIMDSVGDKVVRFQTGSGQFIDWFCVSHDGALDGPNQGVYAPNGDLYVTCYYSDSVRRFNGQSGQFLGELIGAGPGGLDGPTGLAIGQDGKVYVASSDNDMVKVYNPGSGQVSTFIGAGNGLDSPQGLGQDVNGDWYVSGYFSDNVVRFSWTGQFLGVAIPAGTFGLDAPAGVLIDEQRRLYVASQFSDSILVKDLVSGTISQLVAPGVGGVDWPRYLTIEPGTNHLLVVAWGGNGQFLRFNRQTGAFLGSFLSPLAGGLSGDPDMVVFKPEVSQCYADCDENGVLNIDDFICFQTFFVLGC